MTDFTINNAIITNSNFTILNTAPRRSRRRKRVSLAKHLGLLAAGLLRLALAGLDTHAPDTLGPPEPPAGQVHARVDVSVRVNVHVDRR